MDNRPNVYFSIPVSIDWTTVYNVMTSFRQQLNINYWIRNSIYTSKMLENADAVVFVLHNYVFNAARNELSSGISKEISLAYQLKKHVFILYKTNGGDYRIYEADITNYSIKGIAGTTDSITKIRSKAALTKSILDRGIDSHQDPVGELGDAGEIGIDNRLLL